MAHVLTLANAKGGCGKSTVALNLAICFARAGYRTLAVDLQSVIAILLIPLLPPPHLPGTDPQNLRRLPPADPFRHRP